MTLIITHISRYGIIHASDSNLTGPDDKDAGTGQKTYPVTYLNAGLTVAGNYSVSGTHMNIWMNSFVDQQKTIADNTIKKFGNALKDELQHKMQSDEKANGCIIHLAGYAEDNGKSYPEFYLISNVHKINPLTGEYEDIDENFGISEDFWNRDCPRQDMMSKFKNENVFVYQRYINGFPSGRISYNIVTKKLDEFLEKVWAVQGWQFRQPRSLDDVERLVKLYMQVISDLFILSDYNARYIGGGIQTHKIPQPANIVNKCP